MEIIVLRNYIDEEKVNTYNHKIIIRNNIILVKINIDPMNSCDIQINKDSNNKGNNNEMIKKINLNGENKNDLIKAVKNLINSNWARRDIINNENDENVKIKKNI